MHWFRVIGLIAMGAAGGGFAAWWRNRTTATAPQQTIRTDSPGFWLTLAVNSLGNGNVLDPFTANTIAGLRPNQGRYLDNSVFAPVADTNGHVRVPLASRLVDRSHSRAFLFRDAMGNYILFTHGSITPNAEPDEHDRCITAKLYVCSPE